MNFVTPGSIDGIARVPGSKSHTQRALLLAALAPGTSRITHANIDADARAAARVAEALGASVTREGTTWTVTAPAGDRPRAVRCGESATALRLGAPLAALSPEPLAFELEGTLAHRDHTALERAIATAGGHAGRRGDAIVVSGPLHPGSYRVDGSAGSQPLSGLALALAQLPGPSVIDVAHLTSAPYLGLTARVAASFGLSIASDGARLSMPGGEAPRAADIAVPPDWSSAAYPLVAAAAGGRVTVPGLADDGQADALVLRALRAAGAEVRVDAGGTTVAGGRLRAFRIDATHSPDSICALAALAAASVGTSVITGAHRLAGKESDRTAALGLEFGKLGIDVRRRNDDLLVTGGSPRTPAAPVDPHSDHRIAMACAVVALRAPRPVAIDNGACVAKSWATFFADLEGITA